MDAKILQAFYSSNLGYSADRVIADPVFNEAFLLECRALGVEGSDHSINWRLLNLRKKSKVKRGGRAKSPRFPRVHEYQFASEIAVRFLMRRENQSLDWILCDPELAREFDKLAAELSPGFSSVEYRWAALKLRKTKKLSPEIIGRIVPSEQVLRYAIDSIDVSQLPMQQGLYIFFDNKQSFYIGEASNLRSRLKTHLKHSDNRDLAKWFWENGTEGAFLELHLLPDKTANNVRKAVEIEMIRSRQPLFNVQR